jgi:hypothetical protein
MVLFHKLATTTRSHSARSDNKYKQTELHHYSFARTTPHPRSSLPELPLSGKGSSENMLEDGAIMRTTDISLSYEMAKATQEHPAPSDLRLVTPQERV